MLEPVDLFLYALAALLGFHLFLKVLQFACFTVDFLIDCYQETR